jgi:hypothetical protein
VIFEASDACGDLSQVPSALVRYIQTLLGDVVSATLGSPATDVLPPSLDRFSLSTSTVRIDLQGDS